MQRPPIPPFTRATAMQKIQRAEETWNTRDPEKVAHVFSPDCVWRNREDVFQGRAAIAYFLKGKWAIESNYQLSKELWAFTENRISAQKLCRPPRWERLAAGRERSVGATGPVGLKRGPRRE